MNRDDYPIEKVKLFAENAAARNGWALNPDEDFRLSVIEGLFENLKQFGYFLCPCREGWGELEKDRDIVCPCSYCQDDIDEFGHCYCALYVSEKFIKSGAEPGSIPERRDPDLSPE
jgi:ferredoxin-thioredoxin reductase catalytic subunit